jgi:hypothetical protein
MNYLTLTLPTGETFLIRADQVLQVRPYKDSAEIWFPTGQVAVSETVDGIIREGSPSCVDLP